MDADSYDYRITVELTDGKTMSSKFLSSTKFEEGQTISVQGMRCLVSDVTPSPDGRPGLPRIVNVHCLAIDA